MAFLTSGAAVAAPPLPPATAAGTVTIDGKVVKLNHAYALRQPNAFDEAVMDTAVLLTERPVPAELLKVVNLERTIHEVTDGVYFVIDLKGKPRHEMIRTTSLGREIPMRTGITLASFTPVTLGSERIEGRFSTSAPQTLMSHTYEIAVDFNAPIAKSSKSR